MSLLAQTFSAVPGAWSSESYDRFHKQRFVKSKPEEFAAFWAAQPDQVRSVVKPVKGDPRWAMIERVAYLNLPTNAPLENAKTPVRQVQVICIDPKSKYAGNIYNDDSRRLIYLKFLELFFIRPIHMIIKTLYHVTMIGLIRAIVQGKKNKEGAKAIVMKVIRTLVDIFRTPLYGLVLTIVALAALITAPFKRTLLYDFRALTGSLSRELHWGKRYDLPIDLNPCMQRERNIMDFAKNPAQQKLHPEVAYTDPTNLTLVGLDNLLIAETPPTPAT